MDNQDFNFLISKYSNDLMELKEKWSKWGVVTEEKNEKEEDSESPVSEKVKETPEFPEEDFPEEERILNESSLLSDSAKGAESEYPKVNPENYATFIASVFSGDEAYPIEGAKIMIYRENNLHTFLITNANGKTAKVKIESAPAENALVPNSENQEINYFADVFADGFAPKKGLLVSAVGDSDILLTVQLTPLSERID